MVSIDTRLVLRLFALTENKREFSREIILTMGIDVFLVYGARKTYPSQYSTKSKKDGYQSQRKEFNGWLVQLAR